MSDDRDYKGFENDDNEYTKDGNYFNEKEEVKGSYSEDKDSYSDRNSNYFESSQEENYSNKKEDHYEKTDDSFLFEGQDDEEQHIEHYTQRQSSGYAGFCHCFTDLLKISTRRVHSLFCSCCTECSHLWHQWCNTSFTQKLHNNCNKSQNLD